MDSREPPQSPHPHQLQPKNIALVGPKPFTNTSPITMITPITAQFPLSNINTNPSPQSEHLSLKLSVGDSSSGSGSFKRKRGRPRKYFPNGKITLGSSLDPTHAATFASPSSSDVKKNTSVRGRGRPRGSFKKKLPIEMSGIFNLFPFSLFKFIFHYFTTLLLIIFYCGCSFLGVTNGSSFSPHVIIVNRGEVRN